MSKSILIIAGEPSGDTVGGLLSAELKLLKPNLELFGLGGDRMDVSGVDLRYHANQLSFLGFVEVLKHLPFIKEVEKDIIEQVKIRKPSLAILIDYPGFNLRIAAKLKNMGIPIMYYVSPQVWAWGRGRIAKIKKLVDKMVVVFEFEKKMYEKENMPAEWYGHPLLDIVHPKYSKTEFYRKLELDSRQKYIGLFPGSRRQEIEKILPVMKDTIELLNKNHPEYLGIVGCVPGADIDSYMRLGGKRLRYVSALTYDLMTHSEMNLVASGTATLECAILGRPLFILYKTSFITYIVARSLIKIPYVGLVNVVAGEKIIPEFIQNDCSSIKIATELNKYFSDPGSQEQMKERLSKIRSYLGDAGASRRVAESVLKLIDSYDN